MIGSQSTVEQRPRTPPSDAERAAVAWLLEPDTPGVRYLALRDLLGSSVGDADLRVARRAAHSEGPIAAVLDAMQEDGYWMESGPGYHPKYRSTVWAITLLAQLGARVEEDERIARACAYLLDHALADGGRFSATRTPGATLDCLQGNLCWSLVELGCDDPRLVSAYEWIARSVTGEGVARSGERQAALLYNSLKCGPLFACGANGRHSCAWGAVKVLLALGIWPAERRTPLLERAIRQGVEFLFSTDPVLAGYPTADGRKPSGDWWKFGFPLFYITDLLQLAEALAGLGYAHDPRLAGTLVLIRAKQDAQGRWPLEYAYSGKTWVDFGRKKAPNKWVTLRALRVLTKA